MQFWRGAFLSGTRKILATPKCVVKMQNFIQSPTKELFSYILTWVRGICDRIWDKHTLKLNISVLYYGEANVNQESLDTFLGLAEELRLKGLTGSSTENNHEEDFREKSIKPGKGVEERKPQAKTTPNAAKPKEVSDSYIAKPESSSVALVSVEADQLDEKIKSLMTRTENEIIHGNIKRRVWACNICGKEGQWQNIKTHIEANHLTSNIPHPCDICGKISRSRHGLRLHKAKEHCNWMFINGLGTVWDTTNAKL